MSNKSLLIFLVSACVMTTGISLAYAQDKTKETDVNTNAYQPPPQGTFIPCERCVILYPEQYKKGPQACPVCQGAKEHFQPAQMMSREMAQMRLHEIDLEIQDFLHEALLDSLNKPVDAEHLKKLRNLYTHKLIHLLVYNFVEVEPLKEKILTLDDIIEK